MRMYHEDFSALGKRRRMKRQVGNGDRATERNGDRNIVRIPGIGGWHCSDLTSVNQGSKALKPLNE